MSASRSKRAHTAKEDDRSCDDASDAQPRIQAFPPEVLSEIFLIASHSVSRNTWFPHRSPRLPHEETVYIEPSLDALPCTLTRVCKSWRRTALTTPTLWSRIDIELGEGGKDWGPDVAYYREAVLKMASTWITLSRNSPLYVSISIFKNPELPAYLLESMTRWHGLRLVDTSFHDGNFYKSFLNETLPDRAKDLQQLEFAIRAGTVLQLQQFAGNICLSKFPNFKHLSVQGLKLIPEHEAVYQFKYLRAFWRPEDSLRMLSSLPSLTTLIVEVNKKTNMWIPHSRCTATKQITSWAQNLNIDGGGKGLVSILSCTAFPAVCEAHFTISRDGYDEIASPLHECFSYFFQECSSTLTRLNLTFCSPLSVEDHYGLIMTLNHATSLTHLTINIEVIDDVLPVLEALEWRNSRENLCPHLASLKIYDSCYTDHIDPYPLLEQLIATVQSRMEKNRSVKFSLNIKGDEEARTSFSRSKRLRSLQNRGVLKLNLDYETYIQL